MLVGSCALAFQFPDVAENHPAAKQIDFLSEIGVIAGYPDGTFHPDENVTRAEFASMAIRSIGQQSADVNQKMNFEDVPADYWAYDSIKKALYFELVSANSDLFRPDDSVSRAEAITVAVNALADKNISSFNIKKMYTDAQAQQSATRSEVAVVLYDMIEQVRTNPNSKIAQTQIKKISDGYTVDGATVQGNVGTIPAGAIIPISLVNYISSQNSLVGEIYNAVVPNTYVTAEKYVLVEKNARLQGQIANVVPGKWFVRNGVLMLNNNTITTVNDQTSAFSAVGSVTKHRNRFMKIVRFVLKGEKLETVQGGTVYVQLRKPVKIDLSNGWIIE
jgi:hypothetical protein